MFKYRLMNEAGDGADLGATLVTEEPVADAAAPEANEAAAPEANEAAGESLVTGKTEDDKPAEKPAEQQADDKPIEYEEFKLPEGLNANEDVMTEFTSFAQEHKLDQATAQSLIDYHAKQLQATMDAQVNQWNEQRQTWRKAAKADQEYGGEKLQESMKAVSLAVKEYGTPELKQVLDTYGLGDNPEVVRLFYRVGAELTEGKLKMGHGEPGVSDDPAKVLYPGMN